MKEASRIKHDKGAKRDAVILHAHIQIHTHIIYTSRPQHKHYKILLQAWRAMNRKKKGVTAKHIRSTELTFEVRQ